MHVSMKRGSLCCMCLLIFINIQQKNYAFYVKKKLAGVPKEVACDVVSLARWQNNYAILKMAMAIDFQVYSYRKLQRKTDTLKRKTSPPTTFDLWLKQLQ